MPELSAGEAVARARAGGAGTGAARAWRVRRLDRACADYYLVLLAENAQGAVLAAVDAASGEVTHRGRAASFAAALLIESQAAIARADGGPGARAELVWRPCHASRSPLYPLWEIRDGDVCRYVDQSGGLHRLLHDAGPGG